MNPDLINMINKINVFEVEDFDLQRCFRIYQKGTSRKELKKFVFKKQNFFFGRWVEKYLIEW